MLSKAAKFCAALIFAAMALLALANILSRYLFHFSFAATEEITLNLFVALTVIGTGIAFERGAHLGMASLVEKLPASCQHLGRRLSLVASTTLVLVINFFVLKSIYFELTLFHARTPALGIPVWLGLMLVPFFSVFIFAGLYKSFKTT